ncbi:MAG: hypothetical protein HYR85_02060 [Planctomycetes bacterium]|nr:hypothetical protein [Planctomycetota bacterium]
MSDLERVLAWQLGEPDLVVQMPEAFSVPAEGRDVFRCFVVPLDLDADRWVTAVEFRPSNRRVVHHVRLAAYATGRARGLDAADQRLGLTGFAGSMFVPSDLLGGWAPGAVARAFPDGTGKLLPKGADLVIQTHFNPTGKPETERSTVAFHFSKVPPARVVTAISLSSARIDIQPGEKAYVVSKSFITPIDLEAIGIAPHAHFLCRDVKASAKLPDGSRVALLWIRNWDFNWQGQYRYASPVKLPKGTTIEATFTYDNSADNPRNPNVPPKRVVHGPRSTDEMAYLHLQVVPVRMSELPLLEEATRPRRDGEKSGR